MGGYQPTLSPPSCLCNSSLPLLFHATNAFCFACCLQYKKAKRDFCHFLKLYFLQMQFLLPSMISLCFRLDRNYFYCFVCFFVFFFRKRGPGKSHSRFAGNDVCQVIKRCSWCDCHSTRHSIKWMFGCKRDRL